MTKVPSEFLLLVNVKQSVIITTRLKMMDAKTQQKHQLKLFNLKPNLAYTAL